MRLTKRQLKRIIREEYSRLKRRGLLREFGADQLADEENDAEYPCKLGGDKTESAQPLFQVKWSLFEPICETQNSGFNCGIPPLSAAKVSTKNRKLKNILWKKMKRNTQSIPKIFLKKKTM